MLDFRELCAKVIIFYKKKSQNNICFKIMFPCHIIKTVVGDYDFKFFKIVTNYIWFRLKVKTVVGDYDFNHLKKFQSQGNQLRF